MSFTVGDTRMFFTKVAISSVVSCHIPPTTFFNTVYLIPCRFRWVYCQLDTLKSCRRVADVRDKLKKLPRDLEDTYVQMLAAIPEDYREDAHNALRWLVFSGR